MSIPASSIPSIESLGIIITGPLINAVWFYFKEKGHDISISTKFSLGFFFNSLCFLLLSAGLWYAIHDHIYLNLWFIILAYVIVAVGELCISPTSLSMVSSLVPDRYTSAMMGISLLSIGFGGKLAGLLASDAAISNIKKVGLGNIELVYFHSFLWYFMISCATFVISLLLGRYIKKLI